MTLTESSKTKNKQQQSQQAQHSSKPAAWFFGVLGLKGDKFTRAEMKKARDFLVGSIKENSGSVAEIVRVNFAYWEAIKHASDR
jgi:hypothetical protein